MNRSRQRLAHAGIATALRPHVAIAGIAVAEALLLILVACLVRPALVLPVLSIVFLTAAGVLALIAWCIRSDPNANQITVWDWPARAPSSDLPPEFWASRRMSWLRSQSRPAASRKQRQFGPLWQLGKSCDVELNYQRSGP